MFKNPRNNRTFSSNSDYIDPEPPLLSIPKQNCSFIIHTKSASKSHRMQRPLSELKYASNHKSKFSKYLPKDHSFDHERISEDHWSYKLRAGLIEEENFKLKNRLEELIQDQELESNQELAKIKKKIRKLQHKLISREDRILALKSAIKSSKIPECENKIKNSIDEANKLMHLLNKLDSQNNAKHFGEYEGRKSGIATELQALRKENLLLKKSSGQAFHDLEILKAKLYNLENRKQKKIIKAKIAKLTKEKLEIMKVCEKIDEDFEFTEKELIEKVQKEMKVEEENIRVLEENERRIIEQDKAINDMKQKVETLKLASKAKRTMTFMSIKIREEVLIKLMNPPRLLVKINQVLKKKKMLITVFLSLLDKNNNGLMHPLAFMARMKDYGLKVKARHLQELSKLLGTNFTHIPLRKIEEMFDKYKYDNEYISSSSEDEGPTNKKSSQKPSSPSLIIVPSSIQELNKELNTSSFENPNTHSKPSEKILPCITINDITEILEEIKDKMLIFRLPKNKLFSMLFGYDFDPDEGLGLNEFIDYIEKSPLNLQNRHQNTLLIRYIIEPEKIKHVKESEIYKFKGTIREFCRKLARTLPDWEIFSDMDIENFKKLLNENLRKCYKDIMKTVKKIDEKQEQKIKFSEFLNLLKDFDIDFPEKMNSWMMLEFGVKNKQDKFEYMKFLKEYGENENRLNVEDKMIGRISRSPNARGSVMFENLKGLVNKINETSNFGFNRVDPVITDDKFAELIYSVDENIDRNALNAISDRFSVNNSGKNTKEIDVKSFVNRLKELGLKDFPEKNYEKDEDCEIYDENENSENSQENEEVEKEQVYEDYKEIIESKDTINEPYNENSIPNTKNKSYSQKSLPQKELLSESNNSEFEYSNDYEKISDKSFSSAQGHYEENKKHLNDDPKNIVKLITPPEDQEGYENEISAKSNSKSQSSISSKVNSSKCLPLEKSSLSVSKSSTPISTPSYKSESRSSSSSLKKGKNSLIKSEKDLNLDCKIEDVYRSDEKLQNIIVNAGINIKSGIELKGCQLQD
ncbi:hypothetical protein SteCoe_716 [Stentor coeruleus]|uniref:EF-hand domain-containing protein n=1 Tax=Stentor coeruleus TaxID=5963 RepID=A0A1R2D3M8_9CILI|nr:hypothetical protein SteCoe_716 [Stentor coeruleus]